VFGFQDVVFYICVNTYLQFEVSNDMLSDIAKTNYRKISTQLQILVSIPYY